MINLFIEIKKRAHLWYIIRRVFLLPGIKDLRLKKINSEIRNAKYIHLMYNDKFNKGFVDFINKHFIGKEHTILCLRRCYDRKSTPFPYAFNVYEIFGFNGIQIDPAPQQKIIVHSLNDDETVDFLYTHKQILKNVFWLIWGMDLYNLAKDPRRIFLAQQIPYYITDVDGDGSVARKKFNVSPKIFHSGYSFPITGKMIKNAALFREKKAKQKTGLRIQINHSADESTLEMLDILAGFNSPEVEVVTILSYGQLEYKEAIIEKGRKLFGDRFSFLDKMLSPADYAKFLSLSDILILNQNRQQGLGNSFASLALKLKLFIRSDITTYKFFTSHGIHIFPTEEISRMSFQEFTEHSKEDIDAQVSLVQKFFDDSYLAELWKPIFEEVL